MNEKKIKGRIIKLIIYIISILILILIVRYGIGTLKNVSKFSIIEEGVLKFEENTEGYIIRDETVVKGENYKNGMVQIVSEGERVSKGSSVFRYYSNGEEETLKKISELDKEIDTAIENSGITIFSNDITKLENEIEDSINSMYKLNKLAGIEDKMYELNTFLNKKTKITGNLSPANSYIRSLIDQRNELESNLIQSSEIMYASRAGLVTYNIDGYEDKLNINNIDSLTYDYLDSLDIRTESLISTNTECGKIVDNFECCIACPINTEKSVSANIGDSVKLRILNGEEITAKIEKIIGNDDERVIIFSIRNNIVDLLEYRKIDVDIIWWSYSGLKVSNSAIHEENDISYIEREKNGAIEKIYVQILRQNDTYSIIKNYTDDELRELGISEDYIEDRSRISVYDEIVI